MPRKDRRFTGADIGRLFCNNLPNYQRGIAEEIMEDCPTADTIAELIEAIAKQLKKSSDPRKRIAGHILDIVANIIDNAGSWDTLIEYLTGPVDTEYPLLPPP